MALMNVAGHIRDSSLYFSLAAGNVLIKKKGRAITMFIFVLIEMAQDGIPHLAYALNEPIKSGE